MRVFFSTDELFGDGEPIMKWITKWLVGSAGNCDMPSVTGTMLAGVCA